MLDLSSSWRYSLSHLLDLLVCVVALVSLAGYTNATNLNNYLLYTNQQLDQVPTLKYFFTCIFFQPLLIYFYRNSYGISCGPFCCLMIANSEKPALFTTAMLVFFIYIQYNVSGKTKFNQ